MLVLAQGAQPLGGVVLVDHAGDHLPDIQVFLKTAAVIATGSEVAKGLIEDAFTPVVARKLAEYGIEVTRTSKPGDDMARITEEILLPAYMTHPGRPITGVPSAKYPSRNIAPGSTGAPYVRRDRRGLPPAGAAALEAEDRRRHRYRQRGGQGAH